MIKVEVSITGANNLEAQIAAGVAEELRERLSSELADYRCPEHARPIERLTINGNSLDSMNVKITACCGAAAEEASEIIADSKS